MKTETYIEKGTEQENYTVFPNELLQTQDLSWAASGLLHNLLSRPDNWRVRLRQLYKQTPRGEKATNTALKELINAGHVIKEQGENKCNDTYYKVFRKPQI